MRNAMYTLLCLSLIMALQVACYGDHADAVPQGDGPDVPADTGGDTDLDTDDAGDAGDAVTTDTTGDTTTGDVDVPIVWNPCMDYCSEVEASCADENAITFDVDCTTDCLTWAEGDDGDQGGDSVYCRILQAGLAQGDPATYCPYASPDGGEGPCVDHEPSTCEAYCENQLFYCTDLNAIEFAVDCATDCASWDEGELGDTADNTAHCRLYHAIAAGDDPNLHCPHAAPDGGGQCVDPPTCEAYCEAQAANCADGNAITFESGDCATDCATWDEGALGDTADDTAHCRLYHAKAAVDDATLHCPHASPDGGGQCVDAPLPLPTTCESYCETQAANCTGEDAITFAVDCATDCASWIEGALGDTADDTAHCRLYHAKAASEDAALHCPHAGPDGGGKCVAPTTCGSYCLAQAANCTGKNALIFSVDCATECATWEIGNLGDTAVDTAACRLYHATAAADDADFHCPHASPDGGGQCVDVVVELTTCESYCATQAANCADPNAITFAVDCATDCATWDEGVLGDEGNDTAHCRLYHAGAAAGDPVLHCPHAGPDGGGKCVDAVVELTTCESYCETQAANCTGEDAITFAVDCATDCASWIEGALGDTANDTAHCRLYHAEAAAEDADLHCSHASPEGGGQCVDEVIDPPAGPTWEADIKPILEANCSTCHTSQTKGSWSTGDFASTQADSYHCAEMTKAECFVERIMEESMPTSGSVLVSMTESGDLAKIQAWVADGMPEG
jgi:hypothetical protein